MNALRVWWRHRNNPPPFLPDKVTWTVDPSWVRVGEGPQQVADRANVNEDHRDEEGDKWRVVAISHRADGARPVLQRNDGRYRWRDDGFRGF